MKKSIWLWLLATILTLALAYFQRISGPTYPVDGKIQFAGETIQYSFDRSHGGEGDHPVELNVDDVTICAELYWKRYKTNDNWKSVVMTKQDGKMFAYLPHQTPAGKLIYNVMIQKDREIVTLPENGEVVIRFKGDVPAAILIPHIIFIFAAMLLSTRTGLEYLNIESNYKKLVLTTYIFLFLGGMIFGPITQLYAFGALWTGFPFGYDLTDNKTLIAFIGWTIALIAVFKSKNPGRWVIFASILMFIIFLIPHSLFGSELDYSEGIDNHSQVD
jgi:hypothetical protein